MGENALARRNYGELPKIYARLAFNVANDLVQLKGMTQEAADKFALEMMLGQAAETMDFLDEYSTELLKLKELRRLEKNGLLVELQQQKGDAHE